MDATAQSRLAARDIAFRMLPESVHDPRLFYLITGLDHATLEEPALCSASYVRAGQESPCHEPILRNIQHDHLARLDDDTTVEWRGDQRKDPAW
jgi:hypothetical protein